MSLGKKLFSNFALIFILIILIGGLAVSSSLQDVGKVFLLCVLLWLGVGLRVLDNAIDRKMISSPGTVQKELVTGLRFMLYGPFAYKLFY